MMDWEDLPTCAFGSGPALEERLAALVIAGQKRATVWDGKEENPTAPGRRWVVTADGRPVAVIETLAVARRRFHDIDAAFAATEGEGDGSLRFWRATHEDHFRRAGTFAPDMWLWCETFRLVQVIDTDLAARAAGHVAAEAAEAVAYLAARPPVDDWPDRP